MDLAVLTPPVSVVVHRSPEPGSQQVCDRFAPAREFESSLDPFVVDDHEGGCGVNREAFGEVGVCAHVDAADRDGVMVSASLEHLREEAVDASRAPVSRVMEEEQLRPALR
jgi:hypothetical protein